MLRKPECSCGAPLQAKDGLVHCGYCGTEWRCISVWALGATEADDKLEGYNLMKPEPGVVSPGEAPSLATELYE